MFPTTLRTLLSRKTDFRRELGDYDSANRDMYGDVMTLNIGSWKTYYNQQHYEFWLPMPIEQLAYTVTDPDEAFLELADQFGVDNFPKSFWTIMADLRGYVTIMVASGRFSHSEKYGWTMFRHQNRIEFGVGDIEQAIAVANSLIAAFTLVDTDS